MEAHQRLDAVTTLRQHVRLRQARSKLRLPGTRLWSRHSCTGKYIQDAGFRELVAVARVYDSRSGQRQQRPLYRAPLYGTTGLWYERNPALP